LSTTALGPVEEALARGTSVEHVLDIVDDAIEEATRRDDAEMLAALADLLDATAAERGGDCRGLAIAAMRARAAADIPVVEAPLPAPQTADRAAETRYAGWWIRAAAFLVDWVLVGLVYGLLAERSDDINGDLALAIWLFLPLLYFAGLHAINNGATAGKELFGIAVHGPDERRIGFVRAVVRAVATAVLWLTLIGGLIDAIVLGGDRRKQSWHDQIAGTVVIRTRGRRAVN
jgi:uncharacterized RDD family membrane protein YckC